jgi:hypothetical protein
VAAPRGVIQEGADVMDEAARSMVGFDCWAVQRLMGVTAIGIWAAAWR